MSEITIPDTRVFQLSIAQFEDLSIQLAPRLTGKTGSEQQDAGEVNGNDI